MGQKTHPFGFRLGITEVHRSRWYATKRHFGEQLVEDERIRNYIDQRLNRRPPFAAVSDVHIERTREELRVILKTARPGLVIGPKGIEVERLTNELIQATGGRKVSIEILEIKEPELDAKLVSEAVAEQLKKRAGFRRVLRMRADACMGAGALGCKIQISGRLGGKEMSRRETLRMGSIPLQTLQANVDYGFSESKTSAGVIGVKVWIYKGLYTQPTEGETFSSAAGARPRARGRH